MLISFSIFFERQCLSQAYTVSVSISCPCRVQVYPMAVLYLFMHFLVVASVSVSCLCQVQVFPVAVKFRFLLAYSLFALVIFLSSVGLRILAVLCQCLFPFCLLPSSVPSHSRIGVCFLFLFCRSPRRV